MIEGVDVSGYQPAEFNTSGRDFVFIKVTEGVNYENPKWKIQRDWARSHGLVVGYYHYARGLKNIAEADHLLAMITPSIQRGEMVAFDWEDSDVSNAEKDAWVKYVNSKLGTNHKVGLYANLNYWKGHDTTNYAGEFLWIADPGAEKGKPRIQHPWTFHQYSSAGGIDHNVGNFADKGALRVWAGYATSVPKTYDASKVKVGDTLVIGNIVTKVTKIN